MSKRSTFLFIALFMGLAWALRGHFGHENGAAWAGAIGALAILVAVRREDWVNRLPVVISLGAIGWAVGGMMSYGRIIGYTRGTDFGNVFYGLLMLAVVGALYGYIGGGLFGLGLETEPEHKPRWPAIITEMTVGGLLAWGLLIYQFEWKMTPPRSELWAACFGAAVALAWYAHRNRFYGSLRLAAYSALGAGLGFACGDFVQTIGNATGLHFNWWNVMEFILGFGGGLGMIYGITTREWPESAQPSRLTNWAGLIFLLLVLPAVNIIQGMEYSHFSQLAEQIGHLEPAVFAQTQILVAWIMVVLLVVPGILFWRLMEQKSAVHPLTYGTGLLFGYTVLYILFSHVKKGMLHIPGQPEQYFYWLILLIGVALWWKGERSDSEVSFQSTTPDTVKRWVIILAVFIILIAVFALISISIHQGLSGAHPRF